MLYFLQFENVPHYTFPGQSGASRQWGPLFGNKIVIPLYMVKCYTFIMQDLVLVWGVFGCSRWIGSLNKWQLVLLGFPLILPLLLGQIGGRCVLFRPCAKPIQMPPCFEGTDIILLLQLALIRQQLPSIDWRGWLLCLYSHWICVFS